MSRRIVFLAAAVFIFCALMVLPVSGVHDTKVYDYVAVQQEILRRCFKDSELVVENKNLDLKEIIVEQTQKEKILEENSDIISMSELIALSEEVKENRIAAIENASMYAKGINIKYPFYVTGISVEQYDALLNGTYLEGCGKYFRQIEDDYGVNGLFALSVATLESGLGKSYLGQNNHNFYGIRGSNNGWAKFESVESGILYFGELMNKSLYYGETIAEIAPTYCNEEWGNTISKYIGYYVERLDLKNA